MSKFDIIMTNEFTMSFLGMVLYFVLQFGIQYGLFSKKKNALSFGRWWNANSVHIVIGAFVAFFIVAYDDVLIEGYNDLPVEDIQKERYWYLLSGIWLNVLYKIVENLATLINFMFGKLESMSKAIKK